MVSLPIEKRTNPYAETYEYFVKDTRDHVLTVEVDDGLNRRLRVNTPGTGIYSWNVITWPGFLTTVGDIADGYTFTRIEDMVNFFDRTAERHQDYYSDGSPSIDFRYWAEKLSGGRSLSMRVYSHRKFLQVVNERLNEHDELSLDAIAEITRDYPEEAEKFTAKRKALLEELESVEDTHEAAYEFFCAHQDVFGSDPWDHDLTEFDADFIRTCYAIELTVRLWREYEASAEAHAHRNPGDDYVLVEGGLVQNNPALPVFDLDVLKTDFVDENDATRALEIYHEINAHTNARQDLGDTLGRLADFVGAYGTADEALTVDLLEKVRQNDTETATVDE